MYNISFTSVRYPVHYNHVIQVLSDFGSSSLVGNQQMGITEDCLHLLHRFEQSRHEVASTCSLEPRKLGGRVLGYILPLLE
jgi:hypothetical protein